MGDIWYISHGACVIHPHVTCTLHVQSTQCSACAEQKQCWEHTSAPERRCITGQKLYSRSLTCDGIYLLFSPARLQFQWIACEHALHSFNSCGRWTWNHAVPSGKPAILELEAFSSGQQGAFVEQRAALVHSGSAAGAAARLSSGAISIRGVLQGDSRQYKGTWCCNRYISKSSKP